MGPPYEKWNDAHHHETGDPHFQRMFGIFTRSGFRRGGGPASWRRPSDLVDQVHISGGAIRCAPERGPRWQTHAQRRNLGISVLVHQVHVSGALSGACTGKGPQMANPRPTPKPENLGPRSPGPRFRYIIRCLHRKGPQMANPRPTPKPGNLDPPWPPGTSGNPAGYSRGRPLRGLKMIVGSLGILWG